MSTTTAGVTGDRLLVAICNAVAGILRETCGRGPSRCTAHWGGPDLLVVLVHGGFTVAEETLHSGGAGKDVRESRLVLADVLEPQLTRLIEDLTGREVAAFMSATHQHPDYQLEAFALQPVSPRNGAVANSSIPAANVS